MKRFLFVFTLILLTASIASAQDKDASLVIVGDAVYDFGDIKEEAGPATHTFTVKNAGESPLIITRVQPSCGCTASDYTKEPIAAGKTGEISATFNPSGQRGAFTKTVSVFSNGKTGSYILTIKGNVISKQ